MVVLNMEFQKLKICITASAGGHLMQMLHTSESWQNYDHFFVSSLDVVKKKLEKKGRVYIIGECNRQHPLQTLSVFWKALKVIRKEKPNVIFSTGAAPGLLCCFFGKIFGAKIIWLDSIANTQKLSMSGRLVRPFANLILSQWPDVADKYPNVEYAGEVI